MLTSFCSHATCRSQLLLTAWAKQEEDLARRKDHGVTAHVGAIAPMDLIISL
jgi:hypothetical protein